MEIGTAIKLLRKKRKLTQKQLAEMCNISVNALSQIEINTSFPQKSTLTNISKSLNYPISYILFLSISDEDVPEEKKAAFNSLNSAIKSVLIDSES